jgi:hypothetical protein
MSKTSLIITEISITSGATASIGFDVNGEKISIKVPKEIKAYFDDQFSRPKPTKLQTKRYVTLMNLMRAAYLKRREDTNK